MPWDWVQSVMVKPSIGFIHLGMSWTGCVVVGVVGSTHQTDGYRLKGHRVYVGDGIKVSKEGRKMPGVKGLHQESDNISKPEWIRGHYFSALGLLIGLDSVLFASLIAVKLHDGIIATTDDAESRLTEKMAQLCVTHMGQGSYAVLDAYYACRGGGTEISSTTISISLVAVASRLWHGLSFRQIQLPRNEEDLANGEPKSNSEIYLRRPIAG